MNLTTILRSAQAVINSRTISTTSVSNAASSKKSTMTSFMLALSLLFSLLRVESGLGQNVTVSFGTSTGLASNYSTLASAITALNSATINSPVTITLASLYAETAPVGGYTITKSGTSANPITIQGFSNSSRNVVTAPAQTSGALTDAIFKLVGADYIKLQYFDMRELITNTTTTAASNNMTEFGVALFYSSTTNGAQNNTVSNNTITLNRTYSNTFGIYSNSTHLHSCNYICFFYRNYRWE